MTISFCTGHFPPLIMLSTVISLLSLSWGASRAYFIERSQDKADPDPAFFMVLMRVFPLMLVVVLNSLVMWVMISGLIGPLIFPALLITFATDYALVRAFIKEVYTDESEKKEEQNLVHLKASLFSLWLPSIVGDDQSTLVTRGGSSEQVIRTRCGDTQWHRLVSIPHSHVSLSWLLAWIKVGVCHVFQVASFGTTLGPGW